MVLRVTFDTNSFDLAVRPQRHPNHPGQDSMARVQSALKAGDIEGFYSVTMLTLEGIMKKDRAAVFASTSIASVSHATKVMQASDIADLPDEVRDFLGNSVVVTTGVTLTPTQQRTPLPEEVKARARAAKALGLRVLHAVPRIGAFQLLDPDDEYFLSCGSSSQISAWIEKVHEVSRAIEARGVGIAQVKSLGHSFATDPETSWYEMLDKAPTIHEQRAVERAFGEWADDESIAAHISYGHDVFCTSDVGKSNAGASIFDATNREWLTATYGVQFMTIEDLANSLER